MSDTDDMTVQVDIKNPVLRCYLSTLFSPYKDGYKVDRLTLTGAAICALTETACRPAAKAPSRHTVRFYLPHSRATASCRSRFLRMRPEAEMRINATLKREFETNFMAFVTDMRLQGVTMRDIIPLFIDRHGLDAVYDGDVETLKKKYYRSELAALRNLQNTLRALAYYRLRRIRNTLRSEPNI